MRSLQLEIEFAAVTNSTVGADATPSQTCVGQTERIGWRERIARTKLRFMNPNQKQDSNLSHYQLIATAINYLHEHANDQPTLEQLALHLGVSPFYLQRVFSEWAGISPKRFLQFLTKQHAHDLLRAQHDVLTTSITAGLSGPGRLHDLMVTCEAMTPGEIRAGGAKTSLSTPATPHRAWAVYLRPPPHELLSSGICG